MAGVMTTTFDNELLKAVFREMNEKVVPPVSKKSVWGYLYAKYIIDDTVYNQLRAYALEDDAGRQLLVVLHKANHPLAFVELRTVLQEAKENEFLIAQIDAEYTKKLGERRVSATFGTQTADGQFGQLRLLSAASSLPGEDGVYHDVKCSGSSANFPPDGPQLAAQPVDPMPQMQQLLYQLEQILKAGAQSNASLPVKRQPSSLASVDVDSSDYLSITFGDENVYETLNLVTQNMSASLDALQTLQTWRNDCAQRSKDCQYNIAIMSIQQQEQPKRIEKMITLADGDPIRGMTSLNAMLYVIRDGSAEIECYEIKTSPQTYSCKLPSIPVTTGLKDPRDMTSCGHHLMIYIKEDCNSNDTIHWISVSGDKRSGSWKVGEKSAGISVNSRNQLLIACQTSKKIKIMTNEGKSVSDIQLPVSFDSLHHAVELCTGKIVVSHGDENDPESKVCIVNLAGEVLHQYCKKNNYKTGEVFVPLRLAVCGNIFVADYLKKRVIRLRPNFEKNEKVVKVTETGCCLPLRICIDESGRNIFIVDITKCEENGTKYAGACIRMMPLIEDRYKI